VCLVFARTSAYVTVHACGRARWERQPPSFGQALPNGAHKFTVDFYCAGYEDRVLQRFFCVGLFYPTEMVHD